MYRLEEAIALLRRTPAALRALLQDLPEPWILANEGPGTWSAFDVVGHYLHAERTNWIQRIMVIINGEGQGKFPVFDRFAQFQFDKNLSLKDLLEDFETIRNNNLDELKSLNLSEADLDKTGIHPDFGQVTLRQLLATWVAHDLDHLYQIARVMAKRYQEDAGPWKAYLRILRQ